jgi:hypothetical protein
MMGIRSWMRYARLSLVQGVRLSIVLQEMNPTTKRVVVSALEVQLHTPSTPHI